MSLYIALRFKGIVKKEFRELFEPIAMKGQWKESPDEVLRDFGESYWSVSAIPCGAACIIDRWKKEPWERSYNKETGEWIFEADINTRNLPLWEFEDEIIPYLMEKVSHYETWYEAWESHDHATSLSKYENKEMKFIGWINEDGSFTSAEERKREIEEEKRRREELEKDMFKLKRWTFYYNGEALKARGAVFNNPKFINGSTMYTSDVQKIELKEDAFYLTTLNSVYICETDEYIGTMEDLYIVLRDKRRNGTEEYLCRMIEDSIHEKREKRAIALSEMDFGAGNNYVLLCFTDAFVFLDDCFLVKKQGAEPKLKQFTHHVGSFRDSILALDETINIGYYPNQGVHFYRFRVPENMEIYIYNSGEKDIHISGRWTSDEGLTLSPGEVRLIKDNGYYG